MILVDQRGCARWTPHGEIADNTTDDLVADFERLREALGIDKWHVFGGSWGSTLALYYAQQHPGRCLSLVLRGIWLLRQNEIDWWLYSMGWIQPELWRPFAESSALPNMLCIMSVGDTPWYSAIPKSR